MGNFLETTAIVIIGILAAIFGVVAWIGLVLFTVIIALRWPITILLLAWLIYTAAT